MGKNTPLTSLQREKGLLSLIEDAIKMNFNECLIEEYKKQLKQIQQELKDLKDKKERFKKQGPEENLQLRKYLFQYSP